jgi:hypothetical protein
MAFLTVPFGMAGGAFSRLSEADFFAMVAAEIRTQMALWKQLRQIFVTRFALQRCPSVIVACGANFHRRRGVSACRCRFLDAFVTHGALDAIESHVLRVREVYLANRNNPSLYVIRIRMAKVALASDLFFVAALTLLMSRVETFRKIVALRRGRMAACAFQSGVVKMELVIEFDDRLFALTGRCVITARCKQGGNQNS